jgi:hypothetical protein
MEVVPTSWKRHVAPKDQPVDRRYYTLCVKGDAMAILLTLAHNILHLLHPGEPCTGTTLVDCPAFSLHELCSAAIDIGFNFNPDPAFKLTRSQISEAMIILIQGIDQERLRFNTLLGDLSIDL